MSLVDLTSSFLPACETSPSVPGLPVVVERANVRRNRLPVSLRNADSVAGTASEPFMGQWSPNEGTSVPDRATGVTLAERVSAFLHAAHPTKTADNVAADLRVKAARIRKLLQRGSAPDADLFARMIVAWGPEFLAAVVPGCGWLSDAAALRRTNVLDAQIAALTEQRNRIFDRSRARA